MASAPKEVVSAARWIADLGGIGRLPIAPGTWASAIATISAWLLFDFNIPITIFAYAILVMFVLGLWAGAIITSEDDPDPSTCVIDEWVGQWLVILLIEWWTAPAGGNGNNVPYYGHYIAAFVLFRFFDIEKPSLIAWSENLHPAGLAIMVDDIVAALFTAVFLWFLIVMLGITYDVISWMVDSTQIMNDALKWIQEKLEWIQDSRFIEKQ